MNYTINGGKVFSLSGDEIGRLEEDGSITWTMLVNTPPGSARPEPVTAVKDLTGGIEFSTAIPRDLPRWRKKLETIAASAKIVLIGDSTSDYTTSSAGVTNALRYFHTQDGQALAGMTGDADHIFAQGDNGITLLAWLADPTQIAALAATNADLVVASYGINDVRLGLCSLEQMKARITQLVELLKSNLPGADVLLRIPNPFLTTNVGGLNYVTDAGGAINPVGAAQAYSDLLRDAYLSMVGVWPHVDVCDVSGEVFGTTCRAAHPLMADQLHPTPVGATYGNVPLNGGYVEIAKCLAKFIGRVAPAFVLNTNQYKSSMTELFCTSAGNGYIDLGSMDGAGADAAQYPLSTSDVLFTNGESSPISLSSATIYRPFGGTNIRISVAGDHSSSVGKRVFVAGSHPAGTTGDRQVVSVDLASIAAGATSSTSVSVVGARTGDLHDATSVTCSPPASFFTAGLRLVGCCPSANDTVQLLVNNPTGSAVDLASANFTFWVVR